MLNVLTIDLSKGRFEALRNLRERGCGFRQASYSVGFNLPNYPVPATLHNAMSANDVFFAAFCQEFSAMLFKPPME